MLFSTNQWRAFGAGAAFLAALGASGLIASSRAEEPKPRIIPLPSGEANRVIVIGEEDEAPPTKVLTGKTIVVGKEGGKPITVQLIGEAGQLVVDGEKGATKVVETPLKPSEYWLGIDCGPLSPVVKAQLKLAHGVAVAQVVPEGPAAKAGVKENDVLLQFGEATLDRREDLMAVLDKVKESETELKLLREGKETTLKVTPAKRPAASVKPLPSGKHEAGETVDAEMVLKELIHGEGGKDPVRMLFMRPGVMLHGEMLKNFPPDLSVAIAKTGDTPAKITVKKGDKTWEIEETKLDELPADIRPFVQQMLGQHGAFNVRAFPGGGAGIRIGDEKLAEHMEKQFQELHKMLDDVQKRMDNPPAVQALRKEIEALRGQLEGKPKEKDDPKK